MPFRKNITVHNTRSVVNCVIKICTPLSGSAADINKAAMVQTEAALASCTDLKASLLIHIHDELVWEVSEDHVDTFIGKDPMNGLYATKLNLCYYNPEEWSLLMLNYTRLKLEYFYCTKQLLEILKIICTVECSTVHTFMCDTVVKFVLLEQIECS